MIRLILSKKRSVVFTWFLSYVLILFIPISFAVITHLQTRNVLEYEINQSNMFLLKRVQQYVDSLLVDVENLSYEIVLNPYIQSISQNKGYLKDSQQFTVYQAVKNFKLYKISNRSIDHFFVYFEDIDLVVSDSTSTDSKTFYQRCYTQEEITFQQWLELIQGNFKGDYMSLPSGNDSEKYGKSITYARSLPIISKGGTTANMFIMLDEAKFLKDAEGIDLTSKGNAFIINSKNKIIASTSPFDFSSFIQYEKLYGDRGLSYDKFDSKKVAISYIKSSVSDWKYVSVIPMDIFWEKLEYIRKLAVGSFLLCLFIGSLTSYLCLRRNYKPLDELINIFKNSKDTKYDKEYNEFHFIKQAINKTLDENTKISYALMEQNRGLKSVFLARLLKGKEGGVHLNDLFFTYNIHFKTDYFVVIVFYIKNIDVVFCENRDLDPVQRIKLIQFVMTNVIEELVGQKNSGFMTEVDEMLVCLVNLKDSGMTAWKTDVYSAVLESQKFLGKNYNIDFTVAVSNVHETVMGIPQAYSEALQVIEYKKVTAKDEIIYYDQIDDLPKAEYYYPLEKEYQLINCIKAGDFKGVSVLLDDVFNINFEKRTPSIEIVRCLMFNMVSTMLKTLNDIKNICRNDFLEELKPVESLMKCETISKMKCRILNIAEKVCNYLRDYNQNTDYSIRDRVVEFVENNYCDLNLGNSVIAESLGMNPDYVSSAFKRQTGEGLLDYVNTVRIEKAKHVLKESSCNLDEIAEKVGYSSTRTFARLFKKYEGITPGRFREIFKS